jgi:hypothetical protein
VASVEAVYEGLLRAARRELRAHPPRGFSPDEPEEALDPVLQFVRQGATNLSEEGRTEVDEDTLRKLRFLIRSLSMTADRLETTILDPQVAIEVRAEICPLWPFC